MKVSVAEDLCVACGLCCNGAIFADVQVQPGDLVAELRALGLRLSRAVINNRPVRSADAPGGSSLRFYQPCSAFDGSRCRIYPQRPVYCREFECLLLQRFRRNRTSGAAALRQIRKARTLVDRVLALLRQLGDTNEDLPLARRFGRTRDRLETTDMDVPTADLYGQLTVVLLHLNSLLSGVFYPG